ncbi:hypothetical protein WISP_125173 [Willisornis vidua]|uniref:Uncharacterized protein n=1 Tax=Willisornis vidua TaxID=1566151 RepID=A0ABQ9CRE2_9PASS|nr:hypothetical protein WISP_125173 [Willisornis vidua]
MKQRSREQTGLTQDSMLLSACQHWCFWGSAKILILFEIYWLPRQKISGYDSRSQGETSSSSEEEREEEENEWHGTPSWSMEWICQQVTPTSMTEKVLSFFLSHMTN